MVDKPATFSRSELKNNEVTVNFTLLDSPGTFYSPY